MSLITSALGGLSSGSIGSATVDLVLNSTGYSAELEKAKVQTGAMTSSGGGLKSALGGVSAGFAAAAAGAAVLVSGISKAIHTTTEWAGEVRSLQRVTGQSAEQASALAAAGNALGIDVSKLNTGFGLLAKNIVNSSANMEKYGIATKDATGAVLPFDEVLANVSDKFAKLPEGPEQAAFAMNVFGKSGKDLIPILQRGSAGLQELSDEAARAGLIMSQADLAAAKNLSVAQRQLGEAFKGAAVQVGKQFVPAMTTLTAAMTEFATKVAPIVADVLTPLAEALTATAEGVQGILNLLPDANVAVTGTNKAYQEFDSTLTNLAVQVAKGNLTVEEAAQKYNDWSVAQQELNGTTNENSRSQQALANAAVIVQGAVDRLAKSEDGLAEATNRHTDAMRKERLELLSSADGVLGLVASLQQVQEDERELARLRENGKRGTAAYSEAVIKATQDTLALRTSLREQAAQMKENGDRTNEIKAALREMATQAGISGRDFREALGGPLRDILGDINNINQTPIKPKVDLSGVYNADAAVAGLEARLNRVGT